MAEFPRCNYGDGIYHPKSVSFTFQAAGIRNYLQRNAGHPSCEKEEKKLKVLEWLIENSEDNDLKEHDHNYRRLIDVVDSLGISYKQVPVERVYWGGFANHHGWKPLFKHVVCGIFVETSPGQYIHSRDAEYQLNGKYNTVARCRANYRANHSGVNGRNR